MNIEMKVLEEITEKISFLKRITHIKVEINEEIIETNIEHYAKPIDILVGILDYLLLTRFIVKVGDTTLIIWKLPFQSRTKIVKVALEEAIKREKEKKKGQLK